MVIYGTKQLLNLLGMKNLFIIIISYLLIAGCAPEEAKEKKTATFIQKEATSEIKKDKRGLMLKLVVPQESSKTSLYIGHEHYTCHLVLSNQLKETVRVWQDWNSWGYYNITFELAVGDSTYHIKKKSIIWTRNFPSFWLLKPGESHEFKPNLSREIWEGLPVGINGKGMLKAIYQIEEDKETKEHKVWTGRIESEEIEVIVHS